MAEVTQLNKPVRTACALRILADKIDKGEQPDFFLAYLNEDDTISSVFKATDEPFVLVGVLESLKLDILDGNVE